MPSRPAPSNWLNHRAASSRSRVAGVRWNGGHDVGHAPARARRAGAGEPRLQVVDVGQREHVEDDEPGRRLLGQQPDPAGGRVDALQQGLEVEPPALGVGHDDLPVQHAPLRQDSPRPPPRARGSSGSAAARCGCPARPRRRPGRRSTGSRPTWARSSAGRSGSPSTGLASIGATGGITGRRIAPSSPISPGRAAAARCEGRHPPVGTGSFARLSNLSGPDAITGSVLSGGNRHNLNH